MENFYDKEEVFEDKDFWVFDEEVKAEEVAEEPVVEEVLVEKPVVKDVVVDDKDVVESDKPAKTKSNKGKKAVFSEKAARVRGINISAGYSWIDEKLINIVLLHPNVRLASKSEIDKNL